MLKINFDTLGELFKLCMPQVSNTLSMILGVSVSIEGIDMRHMTLREIEKEMLCPSVVVNARLEANKDSGRLLFVLPRELVKKSAGLVMGMEQSADTLDDIVMSTIKEVICQGLEAGSGAVREFLGRQLHNELIGLTHMVSLSEFGTWAKGLKQKGALYASWEISLAGMPSAVFYGVFPDDVLRLMGAASEEVEGVAPGGGEAQEGYGEKKKGRAIPVNSVRFPEFKVKDEESAVTRIEEDRDKIRDISLEVAVQIGDTMCTVKDILNLEAGQMLLLDKQAGAPANILVNGQFIAKGDVFVMDERFAARITEIVNKRG